MAVKLKLELEDQNSRYLLYFPHAEPEPEAAPSMQIVFPSSSMNWAFAAADPSDAPCPARAVP